MAQDSNVGQAKLLIAVFKLSQVVTRVFGAFKHQRLFRFAAPTIGVIELQAGDTHYLIEVGRHYLFRLGTRQAFVVVCNFKLLADDASLELKVL